MEKDNNKKFWDRHAGMYTKAMKSSAGLYSSIREKIAGDLYGNEDVLELACGTGQLSFGLSECVEFYMATDFSADMIENAKIRGSRNNLRFETADATRLEYPDGSFDTVIIANALHIMPEPEKALSEIKRIMKDGGVLYAPTFGESTSLMGKIRIGIMSIGGFRQFYKWDMASFTKFLDENGFKVTESNMMGSRLMPLMFVKCVKKDDDLV